MLRDGWLPPLCAKRQAGVLCTPISGSLVTRGGKPPQCLYRWDEVIGPADSRCISGQGVTYAILGSRHTIKHPGQAMLVAAEADKHRPIGSRRPERSIAAEDMLFYPMLFDHRARDMRLCTAYLLSKLRTRLFGPSDDLLLLLKRKRIEGGGIVHPLLHQDHTPTCTWRPIGKERHLGRLGETGILRPIDEAGYVPTLLVGPPGDFIGKGSNRSEGGHGFSRDIKDRMVGMARHPHPQVMLGSGHRVPIDTTHVLLEVCHLCWHLLGRNARPQRRPESGHQVHASGRHAWFLQVGHHLNQREWIAMHLKIKLQKGVRASPHPMRLAHSPSFRTRWIARRGRLANLGVSRFIDVFPIEIIIRQSSQVTILFVLSHLSSARLRKNHHMLHRVVFLLKISELHLGSCYVPARFAPGMVLTARRC